ncbi:MAG: hypothetical protein FD152_2112 [Xanthobacteraceae bacterium]|nr:MAG: hypothetical protein FD152_2112 [Xanthobacteraceae bacterium]
MSRGIKVRDEAGFLGQLSTERIGRIVFARDFYWTDPDAVFISTGSYRVTVSLPDFDITRGCIIGNQIISTFSARWLWLAYIYKHDEPHIYYHSGGTWNNTAKELIVNVQSANDANGNPVGRGVYAYEFA